MIKIQNKQNLTIRNIFLPARLEVALVDWVDIHDNLVVVLHEMMERLVH